MFVFSLNLFFRLQESDQSAQAPVRLADKPLRKITVADLQADGQLADFQQLGDREIQRHRPLMRFPVLGGLRIRAEAREGLGAVEAKRLEEGGVHGGFW